MSQLITVDARTLSREALVALGNALRPHDLEECTAFGLSGAEAVVQSVFHEGGVSYAVLDESGRPVWVYGLGLVPLDGEYGIWCLGRDNPYKRYFMQESRRVIDRWLKDYAPLVNYVSTGNAPSRRWLTWLGAEWGGRVTVGGVEFIKFILRGN